MDFPFYIHLLTNDTAIFYLLLFKGYCTFEQGSKIEITKSIPDSSLDSSLIKIKSLGSVSLPSYLCEIALVKRTYNQYVEFTKVTSQR